jgi:hypothetical protein
MLQLAWAGWSDLALASFAAIPRDHLCDAGRAGRALRHLLCDARQGIACRQSRLTGRFAAKLA